MIGLRLHDEATGCPLDLATVVLDGVPTDAQMAAALPEARHFPAQFPSLSAPVSITFRPSFHHFDRFELDLRGDTHVRGAAFSCLRLKLADIVLI